MVVAILFSLRFKPVQTYVAQKAAAYLSKELKTTVSIGGLYIKPFKSVVLEDMLVLDLQKDTLANFPKFTVDLNKLSLKERILDITSLQINNGAFFLKDYPDKSSNLDFIIDYFDSGPPSAVKKKKFEFLVNHIILNNFRFKYKDLAKTEQAVDGINFEDINLTNLNGIIEKLTTQQHLIQAQIKNLSFKEKSGFYLKNLSTFATVDTNSIELQKLLLQTNETRLSDYFQMKFNRFKDFNDFEQKVKMKANFAGSRIAFQDIAYFSPTLKKMKLIVDLEGEVSGYLNNLKARKLAVKAGKATYIKGNFSFKGLPEWDQTFMDFKIEMAGTNKKDLDELLTDISGEKVKVIPEIVDKFGNVNFNGSFSGFQNDFIAYGEFKTELGRVKSDVNMKIDQKGIPSYTGNVMAYDFNLSELIGEKDLGRLSAELYVKGKGTKIKELTEELDGRVSYIDYNGYRYHNVDVKGIFDKKQFDGKLHINDPNLQLAFTGTVNLNPELPAFHFNADIKNAELKALHIMKDSLLVDATFSTNFSGNNLNNIQGNFLIDQIKLTNSKGIYHIDSVQLKAGGIGIDRNLSVQSDILDASIKGQYDLNTIVSYYKAIAKTYIPSLETEIIKYNTQIFNFNLRIKRFEPIAELIIPGLSIEDNAILIGNFDSRNNTATLNGYINKLTYKGIVANHIIIDENTTDAQLQASFTSDRVDLSDSLFIKNVNIVNILRNDSLALNIKLSNADDANQLDLNGLVEFASDTTARISILPSNLKINNDDWSIQEKVKISFNDGKTAISNFDLSNGNQLLTVDGVISNDPKDLLLIGFENLKLENFNPFVKTLGLKLAGNINGKTSLYDVLNSPKISDNLQIDSLSFNGISLGKLTDVSVYDKANGKANIFTKIIENNNEKFKIDGELNLAEKTIGLEIKMDESELSMLQPFVNDLVSNLKGYISADLKVEGTFSKPHINGEIGLKESQLTVNYLKTTYKITDKVQINQSVIDINKLVLKDPDNNEAVASGTVDLNNIDNPNIQVSVNAENFLALNTSSKDNGLYYGKAYATGIFSFRGPTNNMLIDINAKTEKGTVFNLPLDGTETVSDKDFITFISKDTSQVIEKKNNFDGIRLNFKLRVDPNSLANIYTVLGKLSGRGNAELNLNISSAGDFEMKGDYIIESGSFDFTALEVINKRFDIKQGGTIRWTGNPANAQINLKAIYALRVNLDDLYKAANRENNGGYANQRVQAEVEMGLSELLLKPKIELDIAFPTVPAVKEELQTYFSDGNNLYKQALSLVIQRRFAPGGGTENLTQQLGKGGKNTAYELLFNQVNNLLSSLNLNFVDINIRALNDFSASTKLFNGRVIINAGIMDKQNSDVWTPPGGFNKDNMGKELEILALIKKDGTLIGKLANKPPTQQSVFANPGVNENQNITSIGLIYNQQFDSFKEFLQKITGQYSREQQRKQAEMERLRLSKEAIINESKNKNK